MTIALRPMSTGEVLDRMFSLYRNNFLLFVGIAALPATLQVAFTLVQASLGLRSPADLTPSKVMLSGLLIMVSASLTLVGALLAGAATAYAVSMVHLGNRASIGESYRKIIPSFGWLLLASLLIGLIIFALYIPVIISVVIAVAKSGGGGASLVLWIVVAVFAILAVVLTVHLAARFALTTAACVLEKINAPQAIGRSYSLSKGASGKIWLVLFLTVVLTYALMFAILVPATLLAAVVRGGPIVQAVLISLGQFISSVLATPIASISLVLIYYDQRVRKEAFDLQLMMEAVGQQPAPPPDQASAAYPNMG